MAIEVPENEKISGGNDGGRKGVDFAIRQRRTDEGSVHIKEREQGGVV